MHLLTFWPIAWQRQLATLVAFCSRPWRCRWPLAIRTVRFCCLLGYALFFSVAALGDRAPDRATVVLALMLGMALLWFALSDPRENWGVSIAR